MSTQTFSSTLHTRGGRLRVAVVDSNTSHIMDVCSCLKSIGWQSSVRIFADGDQALSAGPLSVDLLVLDLDLPDCHGLQLLAELRQCKQLSPTTLVVVRTGLSSRFYGQRCFLAGVTGFICSDSDATVLGIAMDGVLSGVSVFPDSRLACNAQDELGQSMLLKDLDVFILHGWFHGHSDNELTVRYRLSPKQFEACRRRLFAAFGVMSQKAACIKAQRLSILPA